MTERAAKQQEVQSMASSTSDDINSYVNQISASQEEAQQLMADISNADSSITALVQQAEAEKAAEEKLRLKRQQRLRDRQQRLQPGKRPIRITRAVKRLILTMITAMIRRRIQLSLPAALQVQTLL